MQERPILIAALLTFVARRIEAAPLPVSCGSMQCYFGVCTPDLQCECFEGFRGPDCSVQMCPTGRAWADSATSTDVAHAEVECSNKGYCVEGKCVCDLNFQGGGVRAL